MQTANQKTGENGEDLAVRYLLARGYLIKERNYRFGSFEADIICEHQGILVIVEVKSRYSNAFGFPEMAVSMKKKKNLALLADSYIEKTQWMGEVRFDIVSICFKQGMQLEHFKDAFFPGLF
jgi:putative endonuclease